MWLIYKYIYVLKFYFKSVKKEKFFGQILCRVMYKKYVCMKLFKMLGL